VGRGRSEDRDLSFSADLLIFHANPQSREGKRRASRTPHDTKMPSEPKIDQCPPRCQGEKEKKKNVTATQPTPAPTT
jgi:hypothetical protein